MEEQRKKEIFTVQIQNNGDTNVPQYAIRVLVLVSRALLGWKRIHRQEKQAEQRTAVRHVIVGTRNAMYYPNGRQGSVPTPRVDRLVIARHLSMCLRLMTHSGQLQGA